MDLRTSTSLVCGVLGLALATSTILRGPFSLRGRVARARLSLAGFAATLGLWYLAQWLYHSGRAEVWARSTALLALLLPQFALLLFDTILPKPGKSFLLPISGVFGALMLFVAAGPLASSAAGRTAIFFYVFGLLVVGLVTLVVRSERSRLREVQRRVRFLVTLGGLAAVFSLADFLWFIGAPLPPVGAVLTIVFIHVLSESLARERLVDAFEMAGLAIANTALAFIFAGIFYICVVWLGGFQTMYLNAVLGGIVVLILADPVRAKVSAFVSRVFFLESILLEKKISEAKSKLTNTVQVKKMVRVVMGALDASHRTTGAALYLKEDNEQYFYRANAYGNELPERIEIAALLPLAVCLERHGCIDLEAFQLGEAEGLPQWESELVTEQLLACGEQFPSMDRALCIALPAGEEMQLAGILLIRDERIEGAFSPVDISLLQGLAIQAGVVISNSRLYKKLQTKERLAGLGQMAAGLAHEIKNPLGAIHGATQLLQATAQTGDQEFLQIISDEVRRLDRVVTEVLSYARPNRTMREELELNEVVRRCIDVMMNDGSLAHKIEVAMVEPSPLVFGDSEQIRQILFNLIRNAEQAMAETPDGTIRVSTSICDIEGESWGELAVQDTGEGMSEYVLANLFVPFFTTRKGGTGLGLAICHRLAEDMGGRLSAISKLGQGSKFQLCLGRARQADKGD